MVNRGFCSSTGLHRISFVRGYGESFRTVVLRYPGGLEGRLASGPTELSAPCSAQLPPSRCPPCAAPTGPVRCVSGFWTRQVRYFRLTFFIFITLDFYEFITLKHFSFRIITCRIQNPDIPPAGRYGADPAGRRRRAGTGSTGRRRRDCSPRRQQTLLPPDDGRMTSWVCLWKHEQGKSYVNRWRNKTRG